MPFYYDPNKSITLRIRDRLRDLLETDEGVREVYHPPAKIGSIPSPDVAQRETLKIAVSIFGNSHPIRIAGADGRVGINPRLVLTVQRYADNGDPEVDQAAAYDDCVRVTDGMVAALLRYQADPTPALPGQVCRLWDSMEFEPQSTVYRKMNGKFWSSDTLFQIFDDEGIGTL